MKLTNFIIGLKIFIGNNLNCGSSIIILSSSICAPLMPSQLQKYLYYFAPLFLDIIHGNI